MGKDILKNYYTPKEISEKYKLSQSTIRGYVSRGQVIPEDKILKISNSLLIDKAWIDEKYKDKKRD